MSFAADMRDARAEHVRLVDRFADREAERLDRIARCAAGAVLGGGKILLFGNGGSAALAQEIAAELVNRYDSERPAIAALALVGDGPVLTSVGNDTSFDRLFARQIEALGRPGDLALGISTSGASPNVVEGLRAAGRAGLATAAFLGRDGGDALACSETAVVVDGADTARIQEVHLFAAHLLCQRVERLVAEGRAQGTTEGQGPVKGP